MRLTQSQCSGIIAAIESFITNHCFEIRLYGSRVRDDLKGGDIDLLLIVNNETQVKNLMEIKHHLLAAIKKNIGDQKIDLMIATKESLNHDAFLKMIFPQSVLLK